MSTRLSRIGPRLAILVVALVVALVIGEFALRHIACDAAGVETFELVRQRYLGNPLAIFPERNAGARMDALVPGTHADGTIHVNVFGLRGRDISPQKPPQTVRIICLGGSAVFGTGNTNDATTWCAQLERIANQRKSETRVEVLNAGVPKFRSDESIYRFEHRFVKLGLDVAVLYNLHNDLLERRIHRLSYDPRVDVPVPVTNAFERLLSHSAIYLRVRGLITLDEKQAKLDEAVKFAESSQAGLTAEERALVDAMPEGERQAAEKKLIAAKIEALRAAAVRREQEAGAAAGAPHAVYVAQKDLDDYRENLVHFIEVCRAHGIRPVICTKALAVRLDAGAEEYRRRAGFLARYFPDYEGFREVFQAWNDEVRAIAKENPDVVLFDADALMRRDDTDWTDWVHMSDSGSTVFASLLGRCLVDAGVLEHG